MAERRATPRARVTISCLEAEWERIREVAESRGMSINDHVISAGLNVELDPAQTDAPALTLSEAEQRRLLDRVDRLAGSMLSAASGRSIERLLQSVELLLMTTLHDLVRQGRSRELGPLLEAVFGPRQIRSDFRRRLAAFNPGAPAFVGALEAARCRIWLRLCRPIALSLDARGDDGVIWA